MVIGRGIEVDEQALEEFCNQHGVRRLALFGSVLRDDFRPDSDIDVLVEFEPRSTPGLMGMVRMEDELETLLGGRTVDLRTYGDLSRYFRDEVRATGRSIR
jgi:predicted nucleotidyltransferase